MFFKIIFTIAVFFILSCNSETEIVDIQTDEQNIFADYTPSSDPDKTPDISYPEVEIDDSPDIETDTVTEVETETENPETETENPDTESIEPPSPCPEDMVKVGSICIDRYEASRSDATETDQGKATDITVSRTGVIPWNENPISADKVETFRKACENAGKRLCKSFEWRGVCEGPDKNNYSYGNDFDPEICNCVDTFCNDYCQENNIPTNQCNTSANCGYNCGYDISGVRCFSVMPTGHFTECKNDFNVFDVNGNVWEIVTSDNDPRGFEVRGGAYNCAGAESRLKCSYNATWDALYAGFRCCKDPTSF